MRQADRPRFDRNFNLLWSGQTVSELGSMVTTLVLPLLVVIRLHGSTFDVGLVEAAQWLPTAVVSLPVGAWVDRRHKRPLLLASNVGQAVAMGSIPLVAAFGVLTLAQVLVAAVVVGFFNLVFQLSYSNFLRSMVSPDLLRAANSRFQVTESMTRVGGPGLAGLLVSAVGTAFALVSDAISFIVSAVAILFIRTVEPPESRASRTTPYRAAIREGLAFVVRDPLLRSLTISTSLANFCLTALNTIALPYLVRDLKASPATIGLLFAIGSTGGIAGAAFTTYLVRRVGDSRLAWIAPLATTPFGLLLPAAGKGAGLSLFVVGLIMLEAGIIISTIVVMTFRQTYCPHDMLGRVGASMRTLQMGIIPIAAVIGGGVAAWMGNRTALWTFSIANLTPGLWRLLSPYSRLRDLPAKPIADPQVINAGRPDT